MEVKYNDKPITIKTIEVDGKKFTKQLVQQIGLEAYKFVDDKGKVYKMREIDTFIDSQLKELKLMYKVIGWINMHFDKEDYVLGWVGSHNKYDKPYIKSILFINEKDELKRAYITTSLFNTFCKDTPQVFI